MTATPQVTASFCLDTGTHTDDIHQLSLSPDGAHLLSAGECTIRVWDVAQKVSVRRLIGPVAERAEEGYGLGNVTAFAPSPDGRWVVALKDWRLAHGRPASRRRAVTRVEVFDFHSGRMHRSFQYAGALHSLAFSPDGRWLALTGAREGRRVHQGELLWLRTGDLLKRGPALAPLPGQVLALGRNVALEDENAPDASVRFVPMAGTAKEGYQLVLVDHTDVGEANHRLSWFRLMRDGSLSLTAQVASAQRLAARTLAVSSTLAVVAGLDSPRHDGQQGQVMAYAHGGTWHSRTATDSPPASLAFSPSGTELVVGLRPVCSPLSPPSGRSRKRPPLSSRLPQDGPATRVSHAGYEPGSEVVLAHTYRVGVDELLLACTYFGHDDAVAALVVASDGLVWSSGGDHRAIHRWRAMHRIGELTDALRGLGRICTAPGINATEQVLFGNLPARQLPPGHPRRQQRFDLRRMALESVSPSEIVDDDFETEKWFIADIKPSQMVALRHAPDAWGENMNHPDLTLFVGANDEWLLWSRSGYYNASANGAKLAGYHVSRGDDQAALFVPADRFKELYRPGLIAAVVRHGSEARAAQAGVDFPSVNVADWLPPTVELQSTETLSGDTQVQLTFTVENLGTDHPLQRVWVLANGRFVWDERISRPRGQQRFRVQLPLRPGANVFTLLAETDVAKSTPVTCPVEGAPRSAYAPPMPGAAAKLHLLSIGVSDFEVADTPQAHGYKRLKYAHLDAAAVYNGFAKSRRGTKVDPRQAMKNRAFDSVEARLLVNEQATKSSVMNALRELCNSIQQRCKESGAERDVLMVFLSGHGFELKNDRGANAAELYFFNHDLIPSDAEATGVSLIDIGQLLGSVAAEVVLLIDTCHSASGGDDLLSGLNPDELAQRIHGLNERSLYVLSAARAFEEAWEVGERRHGVFTSALLEALSTQRFFEPGGQPGRKPTMLTAMGLMNAVMALVPAISRRTVDDPKKWQTPVCRTFGELLPLPLFKP